MPPAGAQSFSFTSGVEGWTFANPATFAAVTGTYNPAGTSLDLTTADNANSFAFWESPVLALPNGSTGTNSLYRSTFTVRSDLADLSKVPALRVRSSSLNFEQSDALVISSAANGDVSPPTGGRSYSQFFSQPAGVTQFRLDLDILNFDPTDAVHATLSLDNVVVESLPFPIPNEAFGVTIATYDFHTNGSSGFTPRNAAPALMPPQEFNSLDGLSIRGTVAPGSAMDTIFGYWGAESGPPVIADAFYAMTFTVRSTATTATKSQIPTFRFRINDGTLKTSAVVNIDSRDGNSRVPVDGAQESYTLYYQAPSEVSGTNLIISFDYLYAHNTGDDANIAVILDSLVIRQYVSPGF
ncbi:hypothetical protein IT570_09825 [Candidatus Sumerlaeota bacterium]|nr:hypothetical protein [Candidatus Sumerlaeota bacterium]